MLQTLGLATLQLPFAQVRMHPVYVTLRYVTYIYIHTYILMYYMYVGRACAAKADACARLATARENRGAKNRQKARGMYE